MSSEIRITFQLQVDNGNYSRSILVAGQQLDQTTQGANGGIALVGTSESNMAVGDVVSGGCLYMRNLTTGGGSVNWGRASGSVMQGIGTLKGGEFAFMRIKQGETMRWVSTSGTCKVDFALLSD